MASKSELILELEDAMKKAQADVKNWVNLTMYGVGKYFGICLKAGENNYYSVAVQDQLEASCIDDAIWIIKNEREDDDEVTKIP